jgi:hypothetical protein
MVEVLSSNPRTCKKKEKNGSIGSRAYKAMTHFMVSNCNGGDKVEEVQMCAVVSTDIYAFTHLLIRKWVYGIKSPRVPILC